MKLDSLEKLLAHELKDLHSAERQLLIALPKMAKASRHPDLKKAFEKHLAQTETHVERLEGIFSDLDFRPGGHRCLAMAGLIEESEGMIDADADDRVRDAGLIGCAQRVEHYEMASYGTAAALADKLGKGKIVETLRLTLEEEGKTDRDLTRLAEKIVNFEALMADK